MPNRDARDFIVDFQKKGMSELEVKSIVTNMESLVKKGLSLDKLEIVADKLIKDSIFKKEFLADPAAAIASAKITGFPDNR